MNDRQPPVAGRGQVYRTIRDRPTRHIDNLASSSSIDNCECLGPADIGGGVLTRHEIHISDCAELGLVHRRRAWFMHGIW